MRTTATAIATRTAENEPARPAPAGATMLFSVCAHASNNERSNPIGFNKRVSLTPFLHRPPMPAPPASAHIGSDQSSAVRKHHGPRSGPAFERQNGDGRYWARTSDPSLSNWQPDLLLFAIVG